MRCPTALSAVLAATAMLWAVAGAHGQHPNDSIVPEKPKPTPNGLKISRSDDQLAAPAASPDFAAMPEMAPYLDEFEAAENEGGPYDFRLTEPLYDLARAQIAAGRPTGAIKQLQRALHVERINQGLYAPSQLPILGDLIDTYLVIGDLGKADKLHRVRYDLERRAYPLGTPERCLLYTSDAADE